MVFVQPKHMIMASLFGNLRFLTLGVKVWGVVLAVSCCLAFHVAANRTDPAEVYALQSVKRTLIDPLMHLKNWNNGDPCEDNWKGVFCFDTEGNDGHLHVRELQLLNMNLSGTLAPELGKLSHLQILDFMWNQITGSIPKEIGNLSSLKLLLLNGNKLSGSLPAELGYLSNLNRLQVDENNISGPIPKLFANLISVQHLHLNNNSISGRLPHELSALPKLLHLLLDSNNLSGDLPFEYSNMTDLRILQLDNNQFVGAEIPESYGNLSRLVKLSLRNCSLNGILPNLSQFSHLSFVDLSWNHLKGSLTTTNLSVNITTINLSHNNLSGSIPSSFSNLPSLQLLSLENNSLSGSIPSSIWNNKSIGSTSKLVINLQNNLLTGISGGLNPPQNVTVRLQGNPVCKTANIRNIGQFCKSDAGVNGTSAGPTKSTTICPIEGCPTDNYYEYVPEAPKNCFCAAPIRIGYRLKSPSFSYFPPHIIYGFEEYVTHSLNMNLYQLFIASYEWEGPRLRMYLKIFPMITAGGSFNESEVRRIRSMFTSWEFPGSDFYGPYELLNFTLLGPYQSVNLDTGTRGVSKAVLAAVILGIVACIVVASAIITLLVVRRNKRYQRMLSRDRSSIKMSIKVDGVKEFAFKEMALATDNFNSLAQVGRGGYGKVYKGVLSDNTIVAIKRAEEGSLQGKHEFLTEIQLLSRIHHRNLVSLVGYCGEAGEQMLVYEFMSNGTLREWLSGKFDGSLSFIMRMWIALGSAKGILYLHTEANPPIFHRDIKASNILLDSNMNAKVADFGLSRLAPFLDDEGSGLHHVSTVVKGTPGYLDPEYFLTQKLTDKSDIYSLGVVFLELLTGQLPISHGKNLVREVNAALQSGKAFSIVDKQMGSYPPEGLERFTILALRCCEDKTEMRPSIRQVVRELENILQMMPESAPVSGPVSSYSVSSSASSSLANITTAGTGRDTRMSSDVSGSDLTTGVTATISPR